MSITYTLLPTKDPGEKLVLTFAFAAELAQGESLTAAALTIAVRAGADAAPATVLDGSHQVQTPSVLQAIKAGAAGATYGIKCLATTSTGRILAAGGLLAVAEVV
jgi:argininosuccinate synthase